MACYKRFLLAAVFSVAFLASNAQYIESLTVPKVWLKGDSEGITPTRWPDQSGNNLDATATVGAGPIASELFNYNPSLVFDGSDYMKIPYSLEGLSGITLVIVYQASDTTEFGLLTTVNGLSRNVEMTTRYVMGPDSVIDYYGKNKILPVMGSIVQSWSESSITSTDARLLLGSIGSNKDIKPFEGKIAEVLIYDKVLTFLERRQLETYLAIKYGISSDGNYVSSAENVLWDAEKNIEYSNNITGIGREDVYQLYQKQSKSSTDSTDLLVISAGSLAETNVKNQSILNDQDFLVWGDNNESLELDSVSNQDSKLLIVKKRWMLNSSGITANQTPTTVQFNLKGIPQNPLGYWLVIDRSGEGNFNADNLEYIKADSVSIDSIAYYNNILWDKDASGQDAFSFAMVKTLFAVVRTIQQPVCTDLSSGIVKIEVIAGKAPFAFRLKSKSRDFSRFWNDEDDEQNGLSSDNYYVAINDANRYSFERDFYMPLADELKIDLGEDQRISNGEEIVLDATTQIPDSITVSYLWEGNNGFSNTEGKVTVYEPGAYKVTITNSKGCEFSDEIAIAGSTAKEFRVFPSVTTDGHFTIGVSLEETGNVTVEIYGNNGTVYQTVLGENNSEYLFDGFINDPGMYIVVLKTDLGIDSQKLIVY